MATQRKNHERAGRPAGGGGQAKVLDYTRARSRPRLDSARRALAPSRVYVRGVGVGCGAAGPRSPVIVQKLFVASASKEVHVND